MQVFHLHSNNKRLTAHRHAIQQQGGRPRQAKIVNGVLLRLERAGFSDRETFQLLRGCRNSSARR